jgi:hypothetical protein
MCSRCYCALSRSGWQRGWTAFFRLLALIHPPRDIYAVYYNYRMRPHLRPAAVEFLDNILEPQLKPTILPLLETTSEGPLEFISMPAAVGMLASSDDPWLSVIATEFSNAAWRKSHETRERPSYHPLTRFVWLQKVDVFQTRDDRNAVVYRLHRHEVTVRAARRYFRKIDMPDAMYVVVSGAYDWRRAARKS